MHGYKAMRVTPFGNPRVNACLRLSEAYRSLPRPSSPVGAKASTMRPLNLALLEPSSQAPSKRGRKFDLKRIGLFYLCLKPFYWSQLWLC